VQRAEHNLPTQITPLVGREQDIRDVQRLLREARLVTLAGAGGIGKTRLALEVATWAVDRYPDGVSLVELAPVRDASFVLQAIASALGVLEEVGRPLIESVHRRLGAATCLLVVDNCEHLIAATAALTEQLLGVSPGLQVLATSREPLGVRGEAVWRVPPLTLPRAGTS
jgi:predicted ATPase